MESYLLFVIASIVLVLVPGPDMIYMLSRSVAQGRRAGMVAALGINAGAYFHLFAAVFGLSALLLTSAVAFTVIKWTGAAYLIYLGVSALLERGRGFEVEVKELSGRSLKAVFLQGFLSDVLNPKVALFFLAFLPQFVPADTSNPVGQFLLLGVTVNGLAICLNLLLVLTSSWVSQGLRDDQGVARWLQRGMGAVFILLGARLAAEKA